MFRYLLRRLPAALVVLLAASLAIFFLLRLSSGDPAATLAGPDASDETVAAIRGSLGLDEPLFTQYLIWLRGVVTGDLGTSYILHAPIAQLIGESLGNTVLLAAGALLLAVLGGGVLGYLMGTVRNRTVQNVLGALTSLGVAVPTYVTGVLLILVFAVTYRVLPSGGVGPGLSDFEIGVQYLLMPAVALSLPTGATLARFLAASLRHTLDQDFVQTGIAKGLRRRRLMTAHVVPNALPPVTTVLGIQIGQLLGGAIIVETIFAWPGIGQLLLQAVTGRDYLLTQDLLLIAVAVFIVVQIVTDVIDAAIDPRIRLERA
ncbi:ABC transporter permease [Paractinoplanes lichenicola]|uniref:ABC transporter permease n=1 Tax=Paractinoplanes lichenicola TaxID=2802976 RepID=A0ABS1W065_9ACTN|nr:ABC transporter permease [Actinoplanes lichenicola]MBL7260130.1 ABC transporter permease [Actinoplanes lichenicola]